MRLVLSSYEKKGNESLSLIDINLENKEFKRLDGIQLTEPSFVITYKKDKENYIITYTKEPIELILLKEVNGKLEIVDIYNLPYPFTTLTHLFYLEDNSTLYACSYKDGSYLKVEINNNKFENYKGYQNNKPSLCHQIFYNPDEKYINIIDIKNDNINVYDLDLKYIKTYKINLGSGPRHGLYKNGQIYVVTEYSNEVYVIDCVSGRTVQNITTLEKEVKSYGATLFFVNETLYASNRGEETIAIYENDGMLVHKENASLFGNNSRHMIAANNAKYILSCNMDSNELTIMDRESKELLMKVPYSKIACVAEL